MDQELIDYYGALGHEGTSATALASLLYYVENDIIVDAKIEPIERNERSLAAEHLEALMKMEDFQQGHRELIIFDHGYPSYDFIKSLEDKDIG
jgi:hypothetical protein